MAPYRVRLATSEDLDYIYKTWLNNARSNTPAYKGIHGPVFFDGHRRVIGRLLEAHHAVVACNDSDSTHLIGFCCAARYPDGTAVAHYIYVKKAMRHFGVARDMLKNTCQWRPPEGKHAETLMVTHWTRMCDYIASDIPMLYNPYLLYEGWTNVAKGGTGIKGAGLDRILADCAERCFTRSQDKQRPTADYRPGSRQRVAGVESKS